MGYDSWSRRGGWLITGHLPAEILGNETQPVALRIHPAHQEAVVLRDSISIRMQTIGQRCASGQAIGSYQIRDTITLSYPRYKSRCGCWLLLAGKNYCPYSAWPSLLSLPCCDVVICPVRSGGCSRKYHVTKTNPPCTCQAPCGTARSPPKRRWRPWSWGSFCLFVGSRLTYFFQQQGGHQQDMDLKDVV